MAWLNRINPTPAFPAHTGPYKVGSIEVEIPTCELQSQTDDAPPAPLPTVAFRMFYPCTQNSEQKAVRWVPSPQRETIAAYAKFLGANSAFAGVFSLIPQLLYYISMPVHESAGVLEPLACSKKWPVMIFSHGLGGSSNAYSHICGSLASHGLVVVAPQHRDGSSPLSVLQTPTQKEKTIHVHYRPIAHKPSVEVYEARDEQLRIRLWEIGLIYDALTKLDQGQQHVTNVSPAQPKKTEANLLSMFQNILDVHEPGAISFTGHSFGACTMLQLVKSVYYHRHNNPPPNPPTYKPLFTPSPNASLARQITPTTPVTLLDLWTLPIQSPHTAWLRAQPMPCYAAPTGGQNLLAIASEAFYTWSANFRETQRLLAKPKPARSKTQTQTQTQTQPYPAQVVGPHIFYPVASAHLSQSDFGILFPWVTTKVFGAREPERVLRLNTRAILQMLRENGVRVANTGVGDLEIGEGVGQVGEGGGGGAEAEASSGGIAHDTAILSRKRDRVRGWVCLSGDVEGVADGGAGQGVVVGEREGGGGGLGHGSLE